MKPIGVTLMTAIGIAIQPSQTGSARERMIANALPMRAEPLSRALAILFGNEKEAFL